MSNHEIASQERACVYVLARRDRRRFKLGWAMRPLRRARQLPEYQQGKLDLDASRAIWLPSRVRAEQVERSMHKTLAPYRVAPGHHRDGSQEWFAGHAQDTALRMLGQMPLDETCTAQARVVPFNLPPPAPDAVSIETGPQDIWWRIEDLLARLAIHCRIAIDESAETTVTIHRLRIRTTPEVVELRAAALDAETYQCWRDGRPLAFVQTLQWQGEDLVLRFMSLRAIERWGEGEGLELTWQVRGFLARLKRQAPLKRRA